MYVLVHTIQSLTHTVNNFAAQQLQSACTVYMYILYCIQCSTVLITTVTSGYLGLAVELYVTAYLGSHCTILIYS